MRSSLALLERAARAVELVLQARERVEARDGEIENALDALLSEVADDVGRHAGIDGRLDHVGVALIDEHGDRALHRARRLEHPLEHLAVRIFEIDQDDVGIDRVDAGEQVRALVDARDRHVARFAQPILQHRDTARILADDDDLE